MGLSGGLQDAGGLSSSVAIVSSPNTFTAAQTFSGGVKVGTATTFQTETTISEISQSAMVGASIRPTLQHISGTPAPSAPPGVQTDYHGVDLILTTGSANANASFSMFPFESNAQFSGTTTMNRAVSIYGYIQNTSTGTITDAVNYQAEFSNTGTITTARGFYVKPPTNSGTVTNLYGVHIDTITGIASASNTYAIYSPSSAQSLFGGLISTSGGVSSSTSGSVEAGLFTQAGSTYGVHIVMNSAHQALYLDCNRSAAGGGYALQLSGYDYGATISTAQNNGVALYIQQAASGASTGLRINNSGTDTSLELQTAGTSHLKFNANGDVNITNTNGWKIGTAGGSGGQKIGFFAATPVTQPLLATGASHTVDDVITVLQTLGLARQS